MSNGATVTFNDPRRFGSMKLVRARQARRTSRCCAVSDRSRSATNSTPPCWPRPAPARRRRSRLRCCDQRVVAGLGNIYVCEALFRARLSPKRIASTIADRNGKPNERAQALVEAIKAVLNDAIKAGGSSLRDHRRADGSLGDFQHNFLVYDREGEPCPTDCKGKVKRIVQNGRSTFYCPAARSDAGPRFP